jgi:hypothetical protein
LEVVAYAIDSIRLNVDVAMFQHQTAFDLSVCHHRLLSHHKNHQQGLLPPTVIIP